METKTINTKSNGTNFMTSPLLILEQNVTFLKSNETNLMTSQLISEQNVVFLKNNGTKELLRFCENGDIFVNGKLVENDKEVVDGLREFLKGQ